MKPVEVAVVVGVITTLGRWVKGKGLTIDTVVGVVVLALTLALIEMADERVARLFGWLVVVGVGLVHAPIVLDATGLTGKKSD